MHELLCASASGRLPIWSHALMNWVRSRRKETKHATCRHRGHQPSLFNQIRLDLINIHGMESDGPINNGSGMEWNGCNMVGNVTVNRSTVFGKPDGAHRDFFRQERHWSICRVLCVILAISILKQRQPWFCTVHCVARRLRDDC